jgi:phosphoribosyl 1,2-cyclic phosphodiesterase
MYIKFWGTRGSIPTSISIDEIKAKIQHALEGAAGLDLSDPAIIKRYLERQPFTVQRTVGGNTSCVEVRSGEQLLILDAGSGIRLLGIDMMQRGFAQGGRQADILMTHTHWDHIQGFPFFRPVFIPGNRFTFHSPFADLPDRFARQQDDIFFPIPISYMSAKLSFNQIKPNGWTQIGNFKVYPMQTSHPGETYAYRIEDGQSCLVYATDSEYKRVDPASTTRFVEFFDQADLLIFDAQYSLSEALDKPDWGHSTAMMGAEFARRAQVKRLALFHHDPTSSDEKIWQAKEQADAYLLNHPNQHNCEVMVAYEGLNLDI